MKPALQLIMEQVNKISADQEELKNYISAGQHTMESNISELRNVII